MVTWVDFELGKPLRSLFHHASAFDHGRNLLVHKICVGFLLDLRLKREFVYYKISLLP